MSNCTCRPLENPTVMGSCGCPIHGMKALWVEVERLQALDVVSAEKYRQLFEAAEDMRSYVPDYFAEKWGHDEALRAARKVLET
jgi:hypothetical protein